MYYIVSNDYLMHHGILGQRWGIRRYQNEDGSLTPAGVKRYDVSNPLKAGGYKKALNRLNSDSIDEQAAYKKHAVKSDTYALKAQKYYDRGDDKKALKYTEKAEKEAKTRDEHIKNLKNIDSQMWKTMGNAAANGFNVAMIDKPTLNKGVRFVSTAFGAVGGLAAVPYAAVKESKYRKLGYDYMNQGYKFEVKQNLTGQSRIIPSASMQARQWLKENSGG